MTAPPKAVPKAPPKKTPSRQPPAVQKASPSLNAAKTNAAPKVAPVPPLPSAACCPKGRSRRLHFLRRLHSCPSPIDVIHRRIRCTFTSADSDNLNVDLAFGAYQRGYYLTAFKIATQLAEQKNDPKAMALLGELYAGALGVPHDDVKAAQWQVFLSGRPRRPRSHVLVWHDIDRGTATTGQSRRGREMAWPPRRSLAMPRPPIILD